jgi:2-hydroxy-6-oxonona-2,4-dienedioate hydrolase
MLREFPVKYLELDNGERLAYRQAGSQGKTLLLIHGNMSSSVHFDTVMEELENDYILYAVDLRGFGDTTYNQPINSLHDFAKDIKEFVEKMGLKDVTALGWSTGGGIALELAADLPDLIKKVVLVESVGVKGYPMFKKDEKGQPILTQRIHTREEIEADPVQVVPAVQAFEAQNRDFFRMIWNLTIYNLKQPETERYERYLDAILKERNLVDVDYALVHFNMTNESNGVAEGSNRLSLVQADVLIMQGEKDLVVPKMFGLETKKHLGEKAELVILEDSGHSPITDNFSQFINIFTNFVEK